MNCRNGKKTSKCQKCNIDIGDSLSYNENCRNGNNILKCQMCKFILKEGARYEDGTTD